MARTPASRLLLHVAWVLAALLLLGAGTALAGGSRPRHHHSQRADLGEARALVRANSCDSRRLIRAVGRRLSRGREHRRRALHRRARVRLLRSRCAPKPAVSSGRPLYWGATIGDQLTGEQAPWDMGAVAKFEQDAGKQVSLVQFFQPFAQCGSTCSFYSFPTTPLEDIRSHGAIPVLSWSSQSIPSSVNEPDFQLSDVIEGRYDEYIREFATEAREWGHPFFLRFDWEMNGDWFPWGEAANGNQPGEFVAAWRHVHDIFAAAGASNVSWVWCPFVDPGQTMTSLASLYPGDSYVDWTGLDGYNWGTNPASPRGWRTFPQLFSRSYEEITARIAPTKPMMLGEIGSSEQGGSKAAWIADALARIPTEYPQIRGLVWFDKFDDGMDWPIETSSAATAAFAEGVKPSLYVGPSFAGLGGGPIQPPA